MSLRHASLSCFLAAFAAACGGAVFGHTDDNGEGGSTSSGASSGKGGTSSTGGKPSKAGSSFGASSAVGGTGSSAGSQGIAGSTSMGGGVNCDAVDCAFPVCSDGQMPITLAGDCCPRCPPPHFGCSNVECQPVMVCPGGYVLSQPPGACCPGCVPQPGMTMCPKVACPKSLCPPGYIRGDLVGGCCTDCVPDALFCNDDSECVIADRPRSCCGCPQAITSREYDADPCWSDVAMPRPIPMACYPQVVCDAICGACPPALNAACANHHCVEAGLR
jgi:hypothetical protein